MNKNGLQVLENIYAAQRLILMTGVDIIKTFSDGKMGSPSFVNLRSAETEREHLLPHTNH